jgi:hypothetical protein
MASSTTIGDLGSQYIDYERSIKQFRPTISSTFTPGLIVQMCSQELQQYNDYKTIQIASTTASQQGILGVVAETWPGFSGSLQTPPNYTSPSVLATTRGTVGIDVVTQGIHPAVFIDQSGTGAVTIVDKLAIIPSRATAGYGQGVANTAPLGGTSVLGYAVLPSATQGGIASTITAAALAQASQTDTLTGTPAVGDILSVTIQRGYVGTAPGVLAIVVWNTPPLTAAQAVSVTTAAAALVAYLNSQPNFSQYFIASNVAGVVTVTVNSLATPFKINFVIGGLEVGAFSVSLSGMIANSLTFVVASSGGTISTAGGSTLAGGTGFKGTIPVYVAVAGGA